MRERETGGQVRRERERGRDEQRGGWVKMCECECDGGSCPKLIYLEYAT